MKSIKGLIVVDKEVDINGAKVSVEMGGDPKTHGWVGLVNKTLMMQETLCREWLSRPNCRELVRAAYQVITCQKIFHFRDLSFLINFITNPFIFKMYFRISRQVDFKASTQMKVSFPSTK